MGFFLTIDQVVVAAKSMSSIAGPCLWQGGALQASCNPSAVHGGRARRPRIAQFQIAVMAEGAGGEDGDRRLGKEGKGRGGSKGSAQLERWARARRIRLGRIGKGDSSVAEAVKVVKEAPVSVAVDYESDEEDEEVQGKGVYMISDGTGWTADHAVQAALGQFEHCLVDQRCSVNTYLFSQVLKLGLRTNIRQLGLGTGFNLNLSQSQS